MNFQVSYYQNNRGDKLVEKFILLQDETTKSKFARFVDLLEIRGPDLGMPHARNLGSGLYELRIRGKTEVRIFYIAMYDPHTVFLLHGFKKKTQKLPAKELVIARMRQKELTGI